MSLALVRGLAAFGRQHLNFPAKREDEGLRVQGSVSRVRAEGLGFRV